MISLSNDFSSFRSKTVSPCVLPGLSHGFLLRPRWSWLFKRRCQDRCCRPARIKRFLWRRRRGLWVETLMSTVGVQRVFFTHSSSSGSKGSFILGAEFWKSCAAGHQTLLNGKGGQGKPLNSFLYKASNWNPNMLSGSIWGLFWCKFGRMSVKRL